MRMSFPRIARGRSATIILATTVAAGGLSLAVATGASATVPAPARPWPAQLARPVSFSCPAGETPIVATSGWTDALGVSHISYKNDPGLVAMIPPAGLTAGEVTPALLTDMRLGVDGGKATARQSLVRQALNLAKSRLAPQFCRTRITSSMLKSQQPGGNLINDHWYFPAGLWGGYAITEAEHGSAINGVNGAWKVPQSSNTSNTPSAESTWVGVGGAGDASSTWGLIQTGTSMHTNFGYQSWWEYIGSSGCVTPTFCGQYSSINAIRPGDSITAQVVWNSTTQACFAITDLSRSTGSYNLCHPVNVPYDHTSAEWLNENFIPLGYYYDSPGTVSWSNQLINNGIGETGAWASPFTGSFLAIIMGPGRTASGTVACSNSNILSYPVNAATNASGGTSQIVTCNNNLP